MDYLQLFIQCRRVDPDFFDADFDSALDDVRVSVWRHKGEDGKPWKGIDTPSQNGYKLFYQGICFTPLAYQVIFRTAPPPTPEPELTNNEKKALKAFAAGLEATQEFVPDSWFSPEYKLRPNNSISEVKTWKKSTKRGRSLGDLVRGSRKVLRMGRQLQ